MNANTIYNQVERLSEVLRVDARQAGSELGLLPVQLEALHYLSICNRHSNTPMAVTEYLGQTKGTVSQTLKVLEKKALLVKQADEHDKRVSHLLLTTQGRSLVQELIPTKMFKNVIDHLNVKDQEHVSGALNILLTTFLQKNGMKSFGICKSCQHHGHTEDGGGYCHLLKLSLLPQEIQLICKEHVAPQ
jgi:DNA-binding MarR family transcriptional regulator